MGLHILRSRRRVTWPKREGASQSEELGNAEFAAAEADPVVRGRVGTCVGNPAAHDFAVRQILSGRRTSNARYVLCLTVGSSYRRQAGRCACGPIPASRFD